MYNLSAIILSQHHYTQTICFFVCMGVCNFVYIDSIFVCYVKKYPKLCVTLYWVI